ncbi:hypothetical protein BKA60DRAFT_201796 [Fusarium oxysporum]|nr:hypothetical protein BKA60DRAFT_201796 [Fusarium oxysporum]
MSGAEIFSLVSSIITVIDASIQLFEAAEHASGLPLALRDAASRLPLVQESLVLARAGLQTSNGPKQSGSALYATLDACNGKAIRLHNLFETMIPLPGSSRVPRYFKAMRTIANANAVKLLLDEIASDISVLTLNHVVKAATKDQIDDLMREIKDAHDMDKDVSMIMHNTGCGRQYVKGGVGDQNIMTSTGMQINGPSHGSTFNISLG